MGRDVGRIVRGSVVGLLLSAAAWGQSTQPTSAPEQKGAASAQSTDAAKADDASSKVSAASDSQKVAKPAKKRVVIDAPSAVMTAEQEAEQRQNNPPDTTSASSRADAGKSGTEAADPNQSLLTDTFKSTKKKPQVAPVDAAKADPQATPEETDRSGEIFGSDKDHEKPSASVMEPKPWSCAASPGRGSATLNFYVSMEDSHKPVHNASVVLHAVKGKAKQVRGGLQLKTDREGRADFSGVPYGKWRVQVLAPGIRTFGEDYDICQQEHDIVIRVKRPTEQYSIYK